MFETQSIGNWLPERYQKWTPLLISVLITPFALSVGISGFGPEGRWFWVGAVIFPLGEGLFIAAALLNNVPLFYVSLLSALLQYPFYGYLVSLARSGRRTLLAIFALHGLAVAALVLFVFLWRRTVS